MYKQMNVKCESNLINKYSTRDECMQCESHSGSTVYAELYKCIRVAKDKRHNHTQRIKNQDDTDTDPMNKE